MGKFCRSDTLFASFCLVEKYKMQILNQKEKKSVG